MAVSGKSFFCALTGSSLMKKSRWEAGKDLKRNEKYFDIKGFLWDC